MTQAIANSMDILQNSGQDFDRALMTSEYTSENFDEIFDKTLINNDFAAADTKEIEDEVDEGDITALLSNFTDILMKASEEANVEKSLDLTLAKDIVETINSIKSFDILPAEATNSENELMDNEQVLFGQILSLVNKDDNLTEAYAKEASSNDLETNEEYIEPKIKETIPEEAESTVDSEIGLEEEMLKELNIEAIEGETSNNEGMANQQQSPEEFGVKVMLNHSVEKADVTFEKIAESAKPLKADITPEKIIEQITKHFDSLKSSSSVRIVLNPEALGKVNLQIINTKEGLSAQFTVTTNEARNILMKGLDGLKESLLSQGVGVDNISVKVQETEESSYNPDWTEQENSENQERQQYKQQREEKEKGLFEKTIAESMKDENGKV